MVKVAGICQQCSRGTEVGIFPVAYRLYRRANENASKRCSGAVERKASPAIIVALTPPGTSYGIFHCWYNFSNKEVS